MCAKDVEMCNEVLSANPPDSGMNASDHFLKRAGPVHELPGFSGAGKYPPPTMMEQIRRLLDAYAGQGGSYAEVAIAGAGHVPFITHQGEFNQVFHAFLT